MRKVKLYVQYLHLVFLVDPPADGFPHTTPSPFDSPPCEGQIISKIIQSRLEPLISACKQEYGDHRQYDNST